MKLVLILVFLVLEVNCVDKAEWINAVSPVPYPSCGPGKNCVPPHLCRNGNINKYGEQVMVLRIDKCENIEVCCITGEVSKPYIKVPPTPLTCGHRNRNGIIIQLQDSDTEAEFGEFPWVVAIFLGGHTFYCGGSLIHPQVVLTAAHRVYDKKPNEFKVRAGEWERNSENEPLQHAERSVNKIIVHRHFVRRSFHNNAALLILEEAFDLHPHIATVCLPPPDFKSESEECFVSGWGKTAPADKKYAFILKKIALQIVPPYICERNIQKTRMGSTFRLDDSQICAGGMNGEDACEGDGGSALVCPIPNTIDRYYQMGIVSAGVGCGQKDVPGIYTDTRYLMPWIQEEFRMNNLNLTFLA